MTAVTQSKSVAELAPVVHSSKVMPKFKDVGRITSFRSCYGLIGSLKRSATIQSPTEFTVTSSPDSVSIDPAVDNKLFTVDYQHNNDAAYVPKDFFVTKFLMPYVYKCNIKGMHFAVCSHLLNDTPLRIMSGVVNFDHTVDINIFNYVSKTEQDYFVPFKKPLAFVYPLSDLPLKVETIYDTQLFHEMKEENRFTPYYTNSIHKLLKNKNS